MSYDQHDAAMDEMYERISNELYPDHRDQAVSEFTAKRLRSFYLDNPKVMRPAIDALQEVKRLKENGHSSAAVVFCATAIELFLKATVLQPIVYGLVHSPAFADVIVKYAVSQTGFDRYRDLLSRMFKELAGLDLETVMRSGTKTRLMDECREIQTHRNDIIHKGEARTSDVADRAIEVTVAVYTEIVTPILGALNLIVVEKGRIQLRSSIK